MSENKTKLIEVVTLVLAVINTVVVAIGGYFLVGKQQAGMYRSTAELNKIEARLSEVQLKLAESNAKVDAVLKSASIAEKSITLIDSVRPNFFSHKP